MEIEELLTQVLDDTDPKGKCSVERIIDLEPNSRLFLEEKLIYAQLYRIYVIETGWKGATFAL